MKRINLAIVLGAFALTGAEQKLPKDHVWVSLEVQAHSTAHEPIGIPEMRIEVVQGGTGRKLDHVEALRAVPERAGVYRGRIPMNEEDMRSTQVLRLRPVGFVQADFPPRFLRPGGAGDDGGNGTTAAPFRYLAVLSRDWEMWRPEFQKFTQLPEPLRKIMEASGTVSYMPPCARRPLVPLGRLSGDQFDVPATPLEREVSLAKAALLNIWSVLSSTPAKPGGPLWSDMTTRLIRFNEERIVVEAQETLFDMIPAGAVYSLDDPYGCAGQSYASAGLHERSFGGLIRGDATVQFRSVKFPVCQGTLQVTAARFLDRTRRVTATFADFDIDQNRGVAHWIDAARQHDRMGTPPILIYDMLKASAPASDFGYGLRPLAHRARMPKCK